MFSFQVVFLLGVLLFFLTVMRSANRAFVEAEIRLSGDCSPEYRESLEKQSARAQRTSDVSVMIVVFVLFVIVGTMEFSTIR